MDTIISTEKKYRRIQYLFKDIEAITFSSPKKIFTPETRPLNIFLVEKGAVRLFEYDDEGIKKTRFIEYPGDLIGFESFLKSKRYLHYAEPLSSEVKIKSISIANFEYQLKKDFSFCSEFMNFLDAKRQERHHRFLLKVNETSECNIISYLEELAKKIGKKVGFEVLLPIISTHEDLAGILGISRQTVSQTLCRLKKRNAIHYDRKRMIIRNELGKIPRD